MRHKCAPDKGCGCINVKPFLKTAVLELHKASTHSAATQGEQVIAADGVRYLSSKPVVRVCRRKGAALKSHAWRLRPGIQRSLGGTESVMMRWGAMFANSRTYAPVHGSVLFPVPIPVSWCLDALSQCVAFLPHPTCL